MRRRRQTGFYNLVQEVPFPGSVVPAVWFDGNRQAYSDLTGTLPVSSGRIRRINEPTAQGGSWVTVDDNERPTRDANSVRFECIGPAGGHRMFRTTPGTIYRDNCTLIVAYMARDNSFAGPLMGLLEETTLYTGLEVSSNVVTLRTSVGVQALGALAVAPGALNLIAVTYTPTGGEVKLIADGVTTTATFTAAATHNLTGDYFVGNIGAGYLYGSISQALVVPRVLSSTERDAVMTWMRSQIMAVAYPLDRALLAFAGDSITRGTAANYGFTYPFLGLANIRVSKPLTENCDCAIGGTGVTNILQPGSTYRRAAAFYSGARVKNIMTFFLGTNDLANSNSVAYTLYGTGAPDGAGLYAACDAARAMGWKVIICTILPRGDNPGFEATFNSRRAAMNTDIRTNWALHADALCDFALVPSMGADGDSSNATYYSADKVHPIDAGHALLEPTYRAAALSLL